MSVAAVAVMGRRARGWVVRNADGFFAPGAGSDPESGELNRLKRCGELALILGSPNDSGADDGLVARAWDEVGRGEHIARLLASKPLAAGAYWPFFAAGMRSPKLEAQLARLSWLDGHAALSPFARFAIGVMLESIGVAPPWDMAVALTRLALFEGPTSETPVLKAVYLAHGVMWRTGMGRNRAGMGPKARSLYRTVAAHWHRRLGRAALLDPLGEMAIADACVGSAPPRASLELMCACQNEDGSMPPHPGASSSAFEVSYHPTGVAALAGALASRAGLRDALGDRAAQTQAARLFAHYAD